jgi:aminoglycoside phosphotransferase
MNSFAKAAVVMDGASGVDLVEAILRERPDLQGQPVTFPEQGLNANTVFIGNEVFKGPPNKWARDGFDKERRILKQMEGKGLPVPKVTYEGKDFLFFGISHTPGVVLGENFAPRLSLEEQRNLAKEVIDFVIRMAKAFPGKNGEFLMNDDLHYNNIMIDPATKKLTGIIDFGKVAYRDKNTWAPHENLHGYFADMLRKEFNARKAELPDVPVPPRAAKGPSA